MDLSYFDKLIEETDRFLNGLDEDTKKSLNDNIHRYQRFKKNFKLDKRSFHDYQSSLKYYDTLAKKTKSERKDVFESIIEDAEKELFYTKKNYWHIRWRDENRENLVEVLDFFENFYEQFSKGLKSFKGQLYENKKIKMKDTNLFLKKLLRKTLNETLKEKTDMLYGKIKEMEMDEVYRDDYDVEGGDDTPFLPKGTKLHKFDKTSKKFDEFKFDDSDVGGRTTERKFKDDIAYILDLNPEDEGDEDEGDEDKELTEGKMCEQCGVGEMNEGECNECGYSKINERVKDLNRKNKFDYVETYIQEEEDYTKERLRIACIKSSEIASQPKADQVSKDFAKSECKKAEEAGINLTEGKKLVGKQRKLDKNKNNRLDAEDFKLLHKSNKRKPKFDEKEMEEGNLFSGKRKKAIQMGKKEFKVGGKTYPVKESIEYVITDNIGDTIRLSENEMINFIENIINEQKKKTSKPIGGKPQGLVTYEKAHRESGKENKDYLKSLGTKMKDYLKDGSKGKYDMNPETFPQGNGELGKMSKKAYEMTDKLEDFNYAIGGLNNPKSDGVQFDKKMIDKYLEGDSTTGNAPGGNALKSKANKRIKKITDENALSKIKDQSYKRVSQPVFNETNTDKNGKLNLKMETIDERRINILNEEFDRMRQLLGYNRKTQ